MGGGPRKRSGKGEGKKQRMKRKEEGRRDGRKQRMKRKEEGRREGRKPTPRSAPEHFATAAAGISPWQRPPGSTC